MFPYWALPRSSLLGAPEGTSSDALSIALQPWLSPCCQAPNMTSVCGLRFVDDARTGKIAELRWLLNVIEMSVVYVDFRTKRLRIPGVTIQCWASRETKGIFWFKILHCYAIQRAMRRERGCLRGKACQSASGMEELRAPEHAECTRRKAPQL